MSLITCPECGKQISDKATACPHCGAPIGIVIANSEPVNQAHAKKRKKKHPFLAVAAVLGIVIIGVELVALNSSAEYDEYSYEVEYEVENEVKSEVKSGSESKIESKTENYVVSNKEYDREDSFAQNKHTLAEVDPSVVTLYCYEIDGEDDIVIEGTGSGFIAFNDQTVVTNYHVYEMGENISIMTEDEEEYVVDSAIALSEEKDIAILHVSEHTGLTPLEFGNPDVVAKGDKVKVIGSPLGLSNTYSEGIISRIFDNDEMGGMKNFQTTAPISAGSSGGAMFDESFCIVGVIYAGFDDGQNLNLAIPIDVVTEIYSSGSING